MIDAIRQTLHDAYTAAFLTSGAGIDLLLLAAVGLLVLGCIKEQRSKQ